MNFSYLSLFILLSIFIIFLVRAYYQDAKHIDKIKNNHEDCAACHYGIDITDNAQFHKAVVDTIDHEHKHGRFAESKLKKMLTSTRDNILRGIFIGIIEGSALVALNNVVMFSLTGGIVSGVGELFQWQNKFL